MGGLEEWGTSSSHLTVRGGILLEEARQSSKALRSRHFSMCASISSQNSDWHWITQYGQSTLYIVYTRRVS